jgi:hypothetical protein
VYVMYRAVFPNLPMSLDFSTWYAGTAAITVSMLVGLALYGFIISRSRRPTVRPGLVG